MGRKQDTKQIVSEIIRGWHEGVKANWPGLSDRRCGEILHERPASPAGLYKTSSRLLKTMARPVDEKHWVKINTVVMNRRKQTYMKREQYIPVAGFALRPWPFCVSIDLKSHNMEKFISHAIYNALTSTSKAHLSSIV